MYTLKTSPHNLKVELTGWNFQSFISAFHLPALKEPATPSLRDGTGAGSLQRFRQGDDDTELHRAPSMAALGQPFSQASVEICNQGSPLLLSYA